MSEQYICAASWLLTPGAPPVAGGALLVCDGIIRAAGTLKQLSRMYSAPVAEYPGCALIPGFINAHTHLELTHFPSWRLHSPVDYNPRRFTDWIIQLIKISRGLTPADYPPSVREGIRMCLESGTTSVGEIVTNPVHTGIYRQSPLYGRLFFELLGQEHQHFQGRLAGALEAVEQALLDGYPAGLSPHSPYTIGETHLPAVRYAAAQRSLPLSVHLSESQSEAAFVRDGSGAFATDFYPYVGWERFLGHPSRCSSTELLHRHGLLTAATLAVHAVHISATDAQLLKETGVHVALCPRSNELLDVGRAPVALMRTYGIPLCLGTDSLASNDSLSLWDELRFALDIFSGELDEEDLFVMVTAGGASALGLSGITGSLEAGRRADFQVVSCSGSDKEAVLRNVVREGNVQEVYAGGKRYAGVDNR